MTYRVGNDSPAGDDETTVAERVLRSVRRRVERLRERFETMNALIVGAELAQQFALVALGHLLPVQQDLFGDWRQRAVLGDVELDARAERTLSILVVVVVVRGRCWWRHLLAFLL